MGSFSLLPVAARRLDGKVALITGGASGIGECTAKLFCQHGAKVVIADVQDERGMSLCREIGPEFISFVHCDVTDENQVRAAVDAAVLAHRKLDIMFNNAGIIGMSNQILETDASEFARVIDVNLKGAFLGTKHAARVMIPARTRGSIIVTASVASVIGGRAGYAYTSSKHAVVGLAKEAAVELGEHGIRVNCVSPYLLATPLALNGYGMKKDEQLEAFAASTANLKGEVLKIDDVANAALFLASEDSKYVSGHNLLVDGGFSINNALVN